MKLLLLSVVLLIAMLGGFSSAFATGGGWYWLSPPYDEKQILDTTPLSQWWQGSEFDSALECEKARNTLLAGKHKVPKSVKGFMEAAVASRCIKSDDPRLAK